jgi:dTDP-4-dehydrorhamnose 3,5-epimerase
MSSFDSTAQIEGVIITPLRIIGDDRGAVLHMLRSDSEGFLGFGECYFSEIIPGAIKAWKKHMLQNQNLTVPVGRIKLVVFDNREHSRTKGNLMILEIGRPDSYVRITLPAGLWYGFQCISEVPALLVNCADLPHSKEEGLTMDLKNDLIPFSWEKE